MSVPAQRRNSSFKKKRASHFALKKKNLATCSKCQRSVLSHRACSFCGTYNGKEILKIKIKGEKSKTKEKKSKKEESSSAKTSGNKEKETSKK